MSADVKGDAYEGLLARNAQDTKSAAGQYFTPRPLIDAIVDCLRPVPGETICDPKRHLKEESIPGIELVDNVAQLCAMNLLLHGIGPTADEADPPVRSDDALRADPGDRFQVVLTNPPFGMKSSVLIVNTEGEEERQALTVVRDDFWVSTTNKQVNFVQHVKTLLAMHGRAGRSRP